MSNGTKAALIVGTVLVLIGIAGFCIAMTIRHWDFKEVNQVKYETNTYEITEDFQNISIQTDTEDITFVRAGDGICRMVCVEQEKRKHTAEVQNGTLNIRVLDTRKWMDHLFSFTAASPKITLYLPDSSYDTLVIKESTGDVDLPRDFLFERIDISASTGDVKCEASASGQIQIGLNTGDIQISQISSGDLILSVTTGHLDLTSASVNGQFDLTVSTGKAILTDIRCRSFATKGDTGDLTMKNLIAEESISAKRTTGFVKLEGCDAAELYITTDTGDVKGSLLSEKVFITESDTGKVEVPKTITGGRCEISTDTGDIKITVE